VNAGDGSVGNKSNLLSGTAWGDDIREERKAELEQRLQAWEREADHGERKGPFVYAPGEFNLRLTGADVFWLAARTLAGTSEAFLVVGQMDMLQRAVDDSDLRVALDLPALNLEKANLNDANLSGAVLLRVNLSGASLYNADLPGAHLSGANLSGAFLPGANLAGAKLQSANLSEATLAWANLAGANLWHVMFDSTTDLSSVHVTDTPGRFTDLVHRLRRQPAYGPPSVADIHWNEADLTVVDWSGLRRLGDERPDRRQRTRHQGWWWWRSRVESEQATRANTQLARRLRDAGLNDDADRFAYRAQVCQRGVHLLRVRVLRWLFSWLLFVIAGYGYRPLRTLFWYLAVLASFAAIYFSVGPGVGVPLSPLGAVVFSITSFHGRGFFPGGSPGHSVTLDDPLTVMAAMEAVVGLFIEISFIATFTQRYFGK
jgi:uncharacterized protein YjbI with pentapeptide repeats